MALPHQALSYNFPNPPCRRLGGWREGAPLLVSLPYIQPSSLVDPSTCAISKGMCCDFEMFSCELEEKVIFPSCFHISCWFLSIQLMGSKLVDILFTLDTLNILNQMEILYPFLGPQCRIHDAFLFHMSVFNLTTCTKVDDTGSISTSKPLK